MSSCYMNHLLVRKQIKNIKKTFKTVHLHKQTQLYNCYIHYKLYNQQQPTFYNLLYGKILKILIIRNLLSIKYIFIKFL